MDDGSCNLCKQPDSAKHWMTECPHPDALQSRTYVHLRVETYLATLDNSDPTLVLFIKMLAAYVTRHADKHMHKMGMIPHGRLAETGEHLGLASLDSNQRQTYHKAALDLGLILMDGVVTDYVHKRSDGKRNGLEQAERRRQQRLLRQATTRKQVAERKERRKKKRKLLRFLLDLTNKI